MHIPTYRFLAVYKINRNDKWIKEYFGTWTKNRKFVKSWNISYNSITMRRKNIQREPIVISVVTIHNGTRENLFDLT